MKYKSTFILILLLTFFLTGCVQNPEALTEKRIKAVENGLVSQFNDPFWERMTLVERMEHYQVPGVSIAVIDDFQIEWARGYGVLAVGGNQPVTQETLFQAASIGKPVVAAAALKLVEQGRLELDRDVNQYLVSWKVPENKFTSEEKVTLRRLLSHTAGVTVGGFQGYALGQEVPNLLEILDGKYPANSPPIRVDMVPGTQFRYSGGGYMIVQQLLEDVAGDSFPELMEKTVLDPLGMRSSTFASPLPEQFYEIAASGHREDGSVIPGGWYTYPEMGSGASMWTTPSDLARFAISLMQSYAGRSDGFLSQEMALKMLSPQTEGRGMDFELGDDGGDLFYFMHPGGNYGYKSVLVAYPKRGQGVVIMTNGEKGDLLWREILNSVSIEYGWVKNNTGLYLGIFVVIVLGILSYFILRARRVKAFKA